MRFTILRLLVALALAIPPQTSKAQAPGQAVALQRLTGPIELDGRPSDRAWSVVEPLPMTMYQPISGGPPTERSDIRIAYDQDHLYVMACLYDREPHRIQEVSLYRDRWEGDDQIVLLVDSFNDNESGRIFWTTPGGIRGDTRVSADGREQDDNWNTYWDVATTRDQDGWFAELRIPFSSLGFQTSGGTVTMGISVFRVIMRKDEVDIYPTISQEYDLARPSLAQDVSLEGVETGRPVYLTPYLVTGRGWEPVLRPDSASYGMEVESPVETGGDLKVNLSEDLTLDLTVNTDFAQVEADDQQVNLSRFSLFFPEKRQFFLERGGLFSFPTGGRSRLFHSRHIGIHEGEAVRILGGARLVGRVGLWDLGFLSMQTEAQAGLPSENFGVARLRRQVLNPYSNAGAMVVSSVRSDGSYNVAYGLDTRIRLRGDDYLTLRWAQTIDDRVQEDDGFRFKESGLLQAAMTRQRNEGLVYEISARWAGEDYSPGVGFQDRRDFAELDWSVAYLKLMGEESRFRRIDPFQLFGTVVLRNEDGSVESAWLEHDTDFLFREGGSLWWDVELYYEDLPTELGLPGGTSVPGGSYWFARTEGGYNFPAGDLWQASFSGGIQEFYDGWLVDVGVHPLWRASTHLQLGLDYNLVRARFPERDEGFDSHLLRARIQGALNTKVSANAFVQLSSVADFAAANVRVRFNFKEGQDLWLVYNEGWNMERFESVPILPRTDNRTVLFKYTHVFGW